MINDIRSMVNPSAMQNAIPQQQASPTDFRSRWYQLSDKVADLTQQKALGQASAQSNAGLINGLGALGFRGNQNAGSMERLASGAARGMGAAGLAAGQSKYNQLAEMYNKGLSEIELPMMQGQDMQKAVSAGNKRGGILGILGL